MLKNFLKKGLLSSFFYAVQGVHEIYRQSSFRLYWLLYMTLTPLSISSLCVEADFRATADRGLGRAKSYGRKQSMVFFLLFFTSIF
jgi:hypothetical protein